MDTLEQIKTAAKKAGTNLSGLAERLGWSPQLLHVRAKTGKFSLDEWQTIADALGCRLVFALEFPPTVVDLTKPAEP